MHLYEVTVLEVFGTDVIKFVVAKNEDRAKKLILDYYERLNDSDRPFVRLSDLEAHEIKMNNYIEEAIL